MIENIRGILKNKWIYPENECSLVTALIIWHCQTVRNKIKQYYPKGWALKVHDVIFYSN